MIDRESQYAYVHCARFQLPATLAAFALLAATTLVATQANAAPAPKVEICHIPPGNPANFHTIKVSENALSAHLDHGDALGPCNDVCALLCDDGNACTIDDTGDCETEGCPSVPRAEVDCADGNQCTQDDCEPATGCVNPILEGEACDDGAFCTDNDVCDEVGACAGAPIENCCIGDEDCNPTFCNGNFCGMDNRCDSAPPCVPDDIACTESFCNEDELVCGEMPVDALCEDPIDCTVDFCDPVNGCENTPDDSLCGDGIDCTVDVCDPTSGCSNTENCDEGTACNAVTGLCESECVPPPDGGQCVPAPNGLAAWWPFDTDTTDIQSGLTGVPLNGAAIAPASGVVSGALSLDGINDFVEVPDSSALSTPSGLTLDAWVNATTFATNGVIASKYNSSLGVQQISWFLGRINGGELRFVVCDDAVYARCAGADTDDPVLAEGCWHFVAATFDVATQEVKIYVNGVEVSSSPNNTGVVSSIADTDIPVQVGAFTPASGIPENFWHGFIDELEIYDRALSSSEIEGIYSAGVAGKCKVDQAATCNTPACNNSPDGWGGLVFDGQDWEGAVTFTFDDVAAACASDLVAQGCTGSEAFLFSKCRSEIATDGRCVNCVRGFSCSDCRSCRDGLRFGFFGECGGEFVIDTCVEP